MSPEEHARLQQLTTNCVACLMQDGADGETIAVVGTMLIQRIALRMNRPEIMGDAAVGLLYAAEAAGKEANP